MQCLGTLPDLFLQSIVGLLKRFFRLLEVPENEIKGLPETGYEYCPVDEVESRQLGKMANQIGKAIHAHVCGERYFGKGCAGN